MRKKEYPELTSKRAYADTGVNRKHISSRHLYAGEKLFHASGFEFGQGSLFPRHMSAGDISEVVRTIETEWFKYINRKPSAVYGVQAVGNALRVVVGYKKYGLKKVGAFIRNNEVATCFPEQTNGGTLMMDKQGNKTKKS